MSIAGCLLLYQTKTDMETAITYMVYVHAAFGGAGLLAGSASLFFRKGGKNHKAAGRWFTWGMLTSVGISLIVSRLPGHSSDFLFAIGLFTIYQVLAGNRALVFKGRQPKHHNWLDTALPTTQILLSAWMLAAPLMGWHGNQSDILFLVFGFLGLALGVADARGFRRMATDPTLWLRTHLSRMTGAYIASVTAFIVAGLHLSSTLFWIAPTVLGTIYIVYWRRKVVGRSKPGNPGFSPNPK